MPGFWRLKDVREATAGDSSIRSDNLSIRSTLDAEAAMMESLLAIKRAGADAILTYAAIEAAEKLG